MDSGDSKCTKITSTNKIKSPVKSQSHQEQQVIEQSAGFWGYLMQIIYQVIESGLMLCFTA